MSLKRIFIFLRVISFPIRVLRRFTAAIAVLALLLSLSFNVAVLTVSSIHAAASGLLSAAGVSTVAAREAGAKLARQSATNRVVKRTSQNVVKRVQKGAARNIVSVGGEAIPLLGVAVIAGALALEVQDACDTAADMKALEAALITGIDHETVMQKTREEFDCRQLLREELPDFEGIPTKEEIWSGMKSAPSVAYENAKQAGIAISDIDWSGLAFAPIEYVIAFATSIEEYFFTPVEKEGDLQ